jgi:hypothetical protein
MEMGLKHFWNRYLKITIFFARGYWKVETVWNEYKKITIFSARPGATEEK